MLGAALLQTVLKFPPEAIPQFVESVAALTARRRHTVTLFQLNLIRVLSRHVEVLAVSSLRPHPTSPNPSH